MPARSPDAPLPEPAPIGAPEPERDRDAVTSPAIRLVATDLDGTLLRSDRSLSARTVKALAGCAAAGIEVVFVTARPPRVVVDIARAAGVVRIAICGNGTMVHDFETAESTYVHAFTAAEARALVDAVRRILPDAGVAIETGEEVWIGPGYRIGGIADPARHLVDPWESVWERADRVVKVLARSPDMGAGVDAGPTMSADEMLAAVAAGLDQPAELSHSGGRGLLEIAPPGATKAGTLAWYCERRGVAAAEVAAFGDMINDLPMLAWAGTSYAVANAHPEVLAAADRQIASNDEDGVATILESLCAGAPSQG
jgi:hypothetical protein